MKPDDFAFLAQLLRRRSGLMLGQPKPNHVESRLAPVMRRFGFKDIASLMAELRVGRDALARAVTEAMTTNESSFFRDRAAFELFRERVLPELIARRAATKRLRLWSAACAAGQEAYSLAMILDDFKLTAKGWTVGLIATDISADMIARAEQGLYSHFEVQRGLRRSFRPGRQFLAHRRKPAAHGDVPSVQPARFLRLAGRYRRRVLPQRADVFRPQNQSIRSEPHRRDIGAGWLSRAGAGRVAAGGIG
jgi:chemotaxis methyl-accepting protein methylase